jgi:hypothetical protein
LKTLENTLRAAVYSNDLRVHRIISVILRNNHAKRNCLRLLTSVPLAKNKWEHKQTIRHWCGFLISLAAYCTVLVISTSYSFFSKVLQLNNDPTIEVIAQTCAVGSEIASS